MQRKVFNREERQFIITLLQIKEAKCKRLSGNIDAWLPAPHSEENEQIDAITLSVLARILTKVRKRVQDADFLTSTRLNEIFNSVGAQEIGAYVSSLSQDRRIDQEVLFNRGPLRGSIDLMRKDIGCPKGSAIILTLSEALTEVMAATFRSLDQISGSRSEPGRV
jgi:hypothetical protein